MSRARNIYIQSATLNGKPYRKSYLDHADLLSGGELVFQMGPRPSRWGVGPGNEPASRIGGESIVPVPVIKSAGQTFKTNHRIELQPLGGATSVHYTTDGSEPTSRSPRFTKSFVIDKSATIKAIAVDENGRRSRIATAKFQQIPHDWKLTLLSKYSSQYPGGGDFALIDGIRGTTNWSGGAWQGYWGRDLVAVVDLGKPQTISKLGAGFLQEAGSWIWMPRTVEFELSQDGRNFVSVLSIPNDVPDGSNPEFNVGTLAKDFVKNITRQEARYVRIKAVNFGKIPAWHPGSGGDAWIFVDEIIIE